MFVKFQTITVCIGNVKWQPGYSSPSAMKRWPKSVSTDWRWPSISSSSKDGRITAPRIWRRFAADPSAPVWTFTIRYIDVTSFFFDFKWLNNRTLMNEHRRLWVGKIWSWIIKPCWPISRLWIYESDTWSTFANRWNNWAGSFDYSLWLLLRIKIFTFIMLNSIVKLANWIRPRLVDCGSDNKFQFDSFRQGMATACLWWRSATKDNETWATVWFERKTRSSKWPSIWWVVTVKSSSTYTNRTSGIDLTTGTSVALFRPLIRYKLTHPIEIHQQKDSWTKRGHWKFVWFTTWKMLSAVAGHFGVFTKCCVRSNICTTVRCLRPSSIHRPIR